jgi:hypothetical protein
MHQLDDNDVSALFCFFSLYLLIFYPTVLTDDKRTLPRHVFFFFFLLYDVMSFFFILVSLSQSTQ